MAGQEEKLDDLVDVEDFSFSEVTTRFENLKEEDRRRAVRRLTQLYCKEDLTPVHEVSTSSTHSPSVAVTPAVTNVTVENTTDKKLPRFSGHKVIPHGEVTYRKWARCADRLITEVPDATAKKQILKSLQSPADDIAELNREKSVREILEILEKNYGCMEDGEELLIAFQQHVQTQPLASDYMSELYVELGEVLKYGGIERREFDKKLLKQFNRGTTDEQLLIKLRFEDQTEFPPKFADLMQAIRREETVRQGRKVRRKMQAKSQALTTPMQQSPEEVLKLEQRIAELEMVATQETALSSSATPPQATLQPAALSPEMVQMQQRLAAVEERFTRSRVGKIFCFRCGEDDGHLATDCNNQPNKALVQKKQEERRSRFRKT